MFPSLSPVTKRSPGLENETFTTAEVSVHCNTHIHIYNVHTCMYVALPFCCVVVVALPFSASLGVIVRECVCES